MKKEDLSPFKRCRKTRRIVGFNFDPWYMKCLLPVLGIVSIIWILIRVIPKPSRASYPCMQVAAPLAASFFGYLGVAGLLALTVRWVKSLERYKKRIIMSGCSVLGVAGIVLQVYAADFARSIGANDPKGVARGTVPGRVVWVHDSAAVDHSGKGKDWYTDSFNDQGVINNMFVRSILSLTEKETEPDAWDEIFKNFNERRYGALRGYQAGEKIAIKINQNCANNSRSPSSALNASPHMVFALLKSLIDEGGVPQSQITVYDASRFMGEVIINKVKPVYPDVILKEHSGVAIRDWGSVADHPDVEKVVYVYNQIRYSNPDVDSKQTTGKGLPQCVVDADYLINLADLKGHGSYPTLCGKNWYGSTSIKRHHLDNDHTSFTQNKDASGRYITYVDYMGHKDMGEKTVLFMINALTGHDFNWGSPYQKFLKPPFNNQWCSSLFVSQDGVAVDSVGTDFVVNEFDWDNGNRSGDNYDYCDKFLLEASLAQNPPSGTFYDPENDGVRMSSLGVFERWNNGVDREYTGNMGEAGGIQLYKVYADPVAADAKGLITIEAENFNKNTSREGFAWSEKTMPDGEESVVVMQTNQSIDQNNYAGYAQKSPRLDYGVHFPEAGTYYIWVRGTAQAGRLDSSDSCHLGLDYRAGRNAADSDNTAEWIEGFTEALTWSQETRNGPVAQFYVKNAGYHVVNLWMREAGFSADQLILTKDSSYRPAGLADTEPPMPNPSEWAVEPEAISGTEVTMTATVATDPNGVEYRFKNTTLGTQSNWQNSPAYIWGELTPDSSYTFSVQTRDGLGHEGSDSSEVTVSTLAVPSKPTVSLSLDRNGAEEGAAYARIWVHKSEVTTEPITVRVSYSGTAIQGEDFSAAAVRMIDGADTVRGMAFSVVDDDLAEGDETINVSIVPDSAYQIDPVASNVTVIITDNDRLDPVGGWDADPDGDGRNNLLEFVQGTDWEASDAGKDPVLVSDGSQAKLRFEERIDLQGVIREIQSTTNLLHPFLPLSEASAVVMSSNDTTQVLELQLPNDEDANFFKLLYSRPLDGDFTSLYRPSFGGGAVDYYDGSAGPTSTNFEVYLLRKDLAVLPHVYMVDDAQYASYTNSGVLRTMSWVDFAQGAGDKTRVIVRRKDGKTFPEDVHIRPRRYGIEVKRIDENRAVQFDVTGNKKWISIQYGEELLGSDSGDFPADGAKRDSIMVFVTDMPEPVPIDVDLEFQAGEHNMLDQEDGRGIYRAPSEGGKKIYLHRGAWVRGKILMKSSFSTYIQRNCQVLGNGILSGEAFHWGDRSNSDYFHEDGALMLNVGEGSRVSGITLVQPSSHIFWAGSSQANPTVIDQVRCLGWWWNNDGIHPKSGAVIEDCFTRAGDDGIRLIGSDITVRRCVCWQHDNASAIGSSHEWPEDPFSGNLIEDCDVIMLENDHYQAWGDAPPLKGGLVCAMNSKTQEVRNVTFRNCNIDASKSANAIVVGLFRHQLYAHLSGNPRPVGTMEGILFDNIKIYGKPKIIRIRADENCSVSNVVFNNVRIQNDRGEMELLTNDNKDRLVENFLIEGNVSDVRFTNDL